MFKKLKTLCSSCSPEFFSPFWLNFAPKNICTSTEIAQKQGWCLCCTSDRVFFEQFFLGSNLVNNFL
jgi:hypothetical protein